MIFTTGLGLRRREGDPAVNAREHLVREAARAAGDRAGWPVPRALLDYIVATSDPSQSPEALAVRAAGIVEYVRNHPDRPDFASATDRQAQDFFQTIHGQVVHLFGGLPYVLASREDDASASETSARFDAIYTGTDWSSEAGQRYMRDYARRCGVDWAGEHPDLLRLGPGAIEALRDANFRRESFRRLRDAGFDRRDAARVAVGIARYAVQHGLDANEVATETAEAVDSFSAGSAESRQRWIGRFRRFYDNPNDREAQEDMDRALTEMETSGTAEQRERARRMREITGRVSAARLTADTAVLMADTATVAAGAETAEARAAREAREAEAARAAERARQEAAERAAAEAARRRLAALRGGGTPDPAADGPAPAPERPAPGTGHQRAEVAPPRLTTVAPT